MKFHQHIKTNSGEIWVADAEKNGCVKSESESRQAYEARFLKELLNSINENYELDHQPNGAPFLKTHPEIQISIAHSQNWFAIYRSNKQPVGIDLEIPSDQIEKTVKYFLSESELENLNPSNEELTICWGIKEAVFKLFSGNVHSLKEEIQIISIGANQAEAVFHEQKITLKFLQNHNFTLVYTD